MYNRLEAQRRLLLHFHVTKVSHSMTSYDQLIIIDSAWKKLSCCHHVLMMKKFLKVSRASLVVFSVIRPTEQNI